MQGNSLLQWRLCAEWCSLQEGSSCLLSYWHYSPWSKSVAWPRSVQSWQVTASVHYHSFALHHDQAVCRWCSVLLLQHLNISYFHVATFHILQFALFDVHLLLHYVQYNCELNVSVHLQVHSWGEGQASSLCLHTLWLWSKKLHWNETCPVGGRDGTHWDYQQVQSCAGSRDKSESCCTYKALEVVNFTCSYRDVFRAVVHTWCQVLEANTWHCS